MAMSKASRSENEIIGLLGGELCVRVEEADDGAGFYRRLDVMDTKNRGTVNQSEGVGTCSG